MRRVVITGYGVVGPLGADVTETTQALREGRSGITAAPDYKAMGFRSQIHGKPVLDPDKALERREKRFMGDGAIWNAVAMDEALAMSGLEPGEISHPRTGMVMGSGGPSTKAIVDAADTARDKGPRRIGPLAVPKAMCSTNSATLSVRHKIKGLSYSLSSACTTSLHCIGHGAELIQFGKQDVIFAGGGEELDWRLSVLFDAMGAMSSGFNDTPERSSRPFDRNRDGFVIAGGAGVMVLEEYERAKARGATIYGEITGYGATSDGEDMVAPNGEGAVRCINLALSEAGNRPISHINAHATATPVGDRTELASLRTVFGDTVPPITAPKSLTGHAMGAAGVQEIVYSMIMMAQGFIAPTLNVDDPDDEAQAVDIVTTTRTAETDSFISNSFGFGGTNGALIISRVD